MRAAVSLYRCKFLILHHCSQCNCRALRSTTAGNWAIQCGVMTKNDDDNSSFFTKYLSHATPGLLSRNLGALHQPLLLHRRIDIGELDNPNRLNPILVRLVHRHPLTLPFILSLRCCVHCMIGHVRRPWIGYRVMVP